MRTARSPSPSNRSQGSDPTQGNQSPVYFEAQTGDAHGSANGARVPQLVDSATADASHDARTHAEESNGKGRAGVADDAATTSGLEALDAAEMLPLELLGTVLLLTTCLCTLLCCQCLSCIEHCWCSRPSKARRHSPAELDGVGDDDDDDLELNDALAMALARHLKKAKRSRQHLHTALALEDHGAARLQFGSDFSSETSSIIY